MSCQWFQEHVQAMRDGHLSEADRDAALDHLFQCEACQQLLNHLIPTPQRLTERVLTKTRVDPCELSQDQLASFMDNPMTALDADLITQHLDHCSPCNHVLHAMVSLQETLPQMAEMEPPADFSQAVLSRTSHRQTGWTWIGRLRQWLETSFQRPRFALEATYILTIIAFSGLRPSQIQFRQVNAAIFDITQTINHTNQNLNQQFGFFGSQLLGKISLYLVKTQSEYQQAFHKAGKVELPAISETMGNIPAKDPMNLLHQKVRSLRTIWQDPNRNDRNHRMKQIPEGDSHERTPSQDR